MKMEEGEEGMKKEGTGRRRSSGGGKGRGRGGEGGGGGGGEEEALPLLLGPGESLIDDLDNSSHGSSSALTTIPLRILWVLERTDYRGGGSSSSKTADDEELLVDAVRLHSMMEFMRTGKVEWWWRC